MAFAVYYEVRDAAEAKRRLRLAITESCNLRCFFCHGDGGRVRHFSAADSDLSPEDVVFILEAAAATGIQRVKLTGGEPLLYAHRGSNVVDLVRVASSTAARVGIDLSMVSNGSALSREMACDLRDAGLGRITISLHGGTDATFRRYAQAGELSLSSVLRGIESAVYGGLAPVKINTVIYHSKIDASLRNIHEMCDILRIARETGVSEVKFLVIIQNARMSGKSFKDSYVYWDDPLFSEFYSPEMVASVNEALSNPSLAEFCSPGTFRAVFTFNEAGQVRPRFSFQNMAVRETTCEATASGAQVCHCQEGSYALRLLADGSLRSCLWDNATRNISDAIRRRDSSAAIALLADALQNIHPPRPELELIEESGMTSRV